MPTSNASRNVFLGVIYIIFLALVFAFCYEGMHSFFEVVATAANRPRWASKADFLLRWGDIHMMFLEACVEYAGYGLGAFARTISSAYYAIGTALATLESSLLVASVRLAPSTAALTCELITALVTMARDGIEAVIGGCRSMAALIALMLHGASMLAQLNNDHAYVLKGLVAVLFGLFITYEVSKTIFKLLAAIFRFVLAAYRPKISNPSKNQQPRTALH